MSQRLVVYGFQHRQYMAWGLQLSWESACMACKRSAVRARVAPPPSEVSQSTGGYRIPKVKDVALQSIATLLTSKPLTFFSIFWTRGGHEESQISNIHTYYPNNFLKLDGAVTRGDGCNIHQYLKINESSRAHHSKGVSVFIKNVNTCEHLIMCSQVE